MVFLAHLNQLLEDRLKVLNIAIMEGVDGFLALLQLVPASMYWLGDARQTSNESPTRP